MFTNQNAIVQELLPDIPVIQPYLKLEQDTCSECLGMTQFQNRNYHCD
jgi:hypothetical protein